MRRILLTTLAFSAFAGASVAATPMTDGEAVAQRKIALQATAMNPPSGAAMSYARAAPTRIAGIAQTSITSRFARGNDAFTDAGLLCGLMPPGHRRRGGCLRP